MERKPGESKRVSICTRPFDPHNTPTQMLNVCPKEKQLIHILIVFLIFIQELHGVFDVLCSLKKESTFISIMHWPIDREMVGAMDIPSDPNSMH